MSNLNFLIIGAPKCGTSTIHSWLNKHPDLQGSEPKETYYFLDQNFQKYNEYGKCFENSDNISIFFKNGKLDKRIKFESTSQTLYSTNLIEKIKNKYPGLKIIIITRDPAERILSTYNYYKNNKALSDIDEDFDSYVEKLVSGEIHTGQDLYDNALEWSKYEKYINKWEKHFKNSIMKIDFSDLKNNPLKLVSSIEDFLGVDNRITLKDISASENKTVKVRSKRIHTIIAKLSTKLRDSAFRRSLRAIYRKINSRPLAEEDKEISSKTRELINSKLMEN